MTGCLNNADETIDSEQIEARGGKGGGKPDRGDSEPALCSAEPSAPPVAGALVVDGDPALATSVRVEASNVSDAARLIGVRIDAWVGGEHRTLEREPVFVRAGAATSHEIALRELAIDTRAAKLPVRLSAKLIVLEEDGTPMQRVTIDPLEVGPSLDGAVKSLLREYRLSDRDFERLPDLTAVIGAADVGDSGLTLDQLNGPGEDEGVIPETPNYGSAVPDPEGLFHYNFCFRWPVDFDDAGFGEDYGTDPTGHWAARGSRMRIVTHGETLFDGYLNFSGCTGTISTPYHTDYVFTGYSQSQIYGNDIEIRRWDGSIEAWVRATNYVGGHGTKYYTLPQTNRSNLIAGAVFTLARIGSVTGETFIVNDRCRPDGSRCCDCASDGQSA